MPRGRGKSHKGKARHFTPGEELARQAKNLDEWRSKREEESDEDAKRAEDEEEGSEEEEGKTKGVSSLIEVENPNRKVQKMVKAGDLDVESAKPELTRREREAIEKEQARQRYEKLHAEGKTDQARADLARLAIIKKQREEAAKKKEEERKNKEAAAQAAAAAAKSAQAASSETRPPAGSLKAARKKRK